MSSSWGDAHCPMDNASGAYPCVGRLPLCGTREIASCIPSQRQLVIGHRVVLPALRSCGQGFFLREEKKMKKNGVMHTARWIMPRAPTPVWDARDRVSHSEPASTGNRASSGATVVGKGIFFERNIKKVACQHQRQQQQQQASIFRNRPDELYCRTAPSSGAAEDCLHLLPSWRSPGSAARAATAAAAVYMRRHRTQGQGIRWALGPKEKVALP